MIYLKYNAIKNFKFRENGYLSLSYGKVFHQGLDDDISWSSQGSELAIIFH